MNEPKEVAIKVRYTIEFEKQFTYPTWDYETNNDVIGRIELDIENDLDEFIDSNYYRQIKDVRIEERGI
ncbi:hypothetical protein [Staphylococcus kloosii]|jgi:hypothetical protein|uniref:hypothetical protein n=1 Tax=Staphylococcus kloosii TaxID=29384 RepID=UPI00189C8A0B|nr:hypothetical protein [Staphylococcus kloosii]MBF7023721.1 hypothetical protein [Staphylococcus kloosii]